ncbi:MAG: hypothetical protein ABGX27_02600 [Desulfurobacteriaceae bacterium]
MKKLFFLKFLFLPFVFLLVFLFISHSNTEKENRIKSNSEKTISELENLYEKTLDKRKKIESLYESDVEKFGLLKEWKRQEQNIEKKLKEVEKIGNIILNINLYRQKGYCDNSFLARLGKKSSKDVFNYYGLNPLSKKPIEVGCREFLDAYYKTFLSSANSVRNELLAYSSLLTRFEVAETKYTENRKTLEKQLSEVETRADETLGEIDSIMKKYAKKYAFNSKEIERKGQEYIKKVNSMKEKVKTIRQEIEKFLKVDIPLHPSTSTAPTLAQLEGIFKTFKEEFSELDKDFFVVLEGKRKEYRGVFTIYYWDESSERDNTEAKNFEKSLSERLYNLLRSIISRSTSNDVAICTHRNCVIRETELRNIAETAFEKFKRWRDDSYELYVDDIYPVYFHLYKIIEGNTTETKWVEVDKKEWEAYPKEGVIISAKPIGYFREQIISESKKIYSAFVGNPNYGHYVNNDGSSLWEWYGIYRFLSDLFGKDREDSYTGTGRYKPIDYRDVYEDVKERYTSSTYSGSGYSIRRAGVRVRGGAFGGGGK